MTEWWTEQQAGWVGAGIGVVGGGFGAACGLFCPLIASRRAPRWLRHAFMTVWYAVIVVAAAAIAAGLYAGWAGQPWHVRQPLTLAGSILFPLSAALVTIVWAAEAVMREYRADPSRSAGAAPFSAWAQTSPAAWEAIAAPWGPGGRCRRWLLGVLAVVLGTAGVALWQDLTLPVNTRLSGLPWMVRVVSSMTFQFGVVALALLLGFVMMQRQVLRLRRRIEERRLAAAELRRS